MTDANKCGPNRICKARCPDGWMHFGSFIKRVAKVYMEVVGWEGLEATRDYESIPEYKAARDAALASLSDARKKLEALRALHCRIYHEREKKGGA